MNRNTLHTRQRAPRSYPALRASLSGLAISILLALSSTPHPAHAQESAIQISIPAQPLGDALINLANRYSLELAYSPDIVAGRQAPALSGLLTADEALRQLLEGTGIAFRRTGTNVSLSQSAQGNTTQLAPVTVIGQAGSMTEGTGSYASSTLNIGKGAQNIRDIPQSVTVISRQRIEDQGMQTLGDVFKNTTGVTTSQRDNEPIGRVYARGFEIQNMQVNGSSVGPWSPLYFNPNLAMFDHVEVVRGADGLFSGNGTPGGSVNLVRKMPLTETQVLLNLSAGKWDRYRAELDATGALLADGKVRGRAVISKEDRKGFLDNDWGRNTFLYGTLDVDLGPTTTLSIGGSYEKEKKFAVSTGVPRGLDGSDLGLPRSWSASRYDWSTKEAESKDIFAQISHAFNNNWEFKLNVNYGKRNQNITGANYIITTGVDPVTRYVEVVDRSKAQWSSTPIQNFESEYKNADINLQGSFAALAREHTFLLGADWAKFNTVETFRSYRPGIGEGGAWSGPIDRLDEAPKIYPYPSSEITQPYGAWLSNITQYGLYGRLNWSLTENAKFIGGARYAYYKSDSPSYTYDVTSGALANSSATTFKDKGIFTPYVGLIYDINKSWTAYGSVTETYESQANRHSGPPESPNALDPVTGRNYEIGLKGELNNGKLIPAIALYRIERSNVAVRDSRYPNTPMEDGHSCCYSTGGKQVSQGVDLELTGELAPGWQIAAGYTYNRNKDKATNDVYHSTTPRHMFRLWTNYRLPKAYSAWNVGLGVNLQSRSYVAGTAYSYNQSTGKFDGPSRSVKYSQGGYAVWNAAVHYDINPDWRASLNLNNLFDKRYYANMGYLYMGNIYGEPFNWMLTLRGRF